MQFAVCIESICTIQTDSAHRVHSWVGFCILHLHCAFCTTLFWPLLPILGEFLHSAPTSCIGTLSALSWLCVCFCILHPASCMPSCTSLTAVALGPLLHSASCICILHRVHAVHSFGADSAFGILHLHPASGAVHSFGADSAHLHPASGAAHSFGAEERLSAAFLFRE